MRVRPKPLNRRIIVGRRMTVKPRAVARAVDRRAPGPLRDGRVAGCDAGACDPMRMAAPNPFNRADYLLAAHTHRQLPPDGGREVAFAGRSNAGKSSALNALCGRNALARVSKTPGRTQQLV